MLKKSTSLRARRRLWGARSGMTLMEIMVVIAIIGTIATVVAVNVFGTFSKSNVKTTEIKMGNIHKELVTHASLNNMKFPSALSELDGVKNQDSWGNEFKYEASGRSYTLTSYGEDGKQGGAGVNADLVMQTGEMVEQ